MTGNALGTAFSLLLLASSIQGLRDVELSHSKTMEAVVGQNITLPCIAKSRHADLKVVNIEWSKEKNENVKLVLHSVGHGTIHFWPNVRIQLIKNDADKVVGSYLHLPEVNKWDSGTYICEVATFPWGSIKAETELTIKDDIKITCDVDDIVEVHSGENATIRCNAFPNAQYRWTKNETLVSENESLELWWVTEAQAGVYTLTVNTGNRSLRKDFIITVLTATTISMPDLETVTPQGSTESADSSLTTSPNTGSSTHVNWTTSISTSNPNTSSATIPPAEHETSFTNSTHTSVTSSPATVSDTRQILNSTTSSYGSTAFRPTQEMASDETRNGSTVHTLHPEIFSIRPQESSTSGNISEKSESPDATPTLSAGTTMPVTENKDPTRSHLLLVLIIVPMVVLIAVVGFLYRRAVIKRRMDLPPPFKPPPPPVKYTAARRSDVPPQSFPTSRCNSVTDPRDMKLMFIKI